MTSHLLFVYGTLRKGGASAISRLYPDSRFIANAAVGGRLYDLGEFPALLLDESSASVIGEIYEIDDNALNALDEFEASAAYLRRQVEISVNGEMRLCWVYGPEPELCVGKKLVASGDWIRNAGSC